MFANAGFGAERGFLEESVEHWRAMVLTNVLGVALTIRATLPHLLERGTGHYLITSSVAGRRVLPGSLYSATKWAVTAIGEALRAELRQIHDNSGIRVTLIEPGMTDTEFFDRRPTGALEDDDLARAAVFALSQPKRVDSTRSSSGRRPSPASRPGVNDLPASARSPWRTPSPPPDG